MEFLVWLRYDPTQTVRKRLSLNLKLGRVDQKRSIFESIRNFINFYTVFIDGLKTLIYFRQQFDWNLLQQWSVENNFCQNGPANKTPS